MRFLYSHAKHFADESDRQTAEKIRAQTSRCHLRNCFNSGRYSLTYMMERGRFTVKILGHLPNGGCPKRKAFSYAKGARVAVFHISADENGLGNRIRKIIHLYRFVSKQSGARHWIYGRHQVLFRQQYSRLGFKTRQYPSPPDTAGLVLKWIPASLFLRHGAGRT